MALKEPTSVQECVYFTNRTIGNGKAMAWVFKEMCPKCKKGTMGKPKDAKTGKTQIRAKEYRCPSCGFTMQKQEYEDTLTANVSYTCPHCANKGEAQVPFKRKKIEGIDTLRAKCSKCGGNIDITKKMKSKGEPDNK
ncbi:MAG: hypothetical protein V1837_01240 [Candidatus Woesearchaeota archaeon]